MTSDFNHSQVSAPEVTGASARVTQRPLSSAHFYERRQRVYTALLLFVVIAGLPMVGLPPLRHRLSVRIHALRLAMAGGITPVTVKVGENHEPFPREYEKPAPIPPQAPKLPPLERIFTAERSNAPLTAPPSVPRATRRLQIPPRTASMESTPPPGASAQPAEEAAPAEDITPHYQQGRIEQDAYDLLLISNSTVAGMIQGSNPSLHFKSWDAAKRGDDAYWVRLTFISSQGNNAVEYIWQVKLLSKEVTPLSYNARAIAQP